MNQALFLGLFATLSIPTLSTAQTWSPVGSGAASAVYALEAFNGELIAGGTFTEIGGVSTNYIARWNGSTWSAMGNLIVFMAADGLYANDTALFIGDGGRVRWWNGGAIQLLTGNASSSFNSTAYSIAHFRDTLYAGGFFSTPFARIARWNGTQYESLTSGCNAQVSALIPFADHLFVGGNFTVAGDSLVNHTALWDGSAWHKMGAGVNNDVFTHCLFQDTLYIGGRFTMANGQAVSRVAKWNGSQWVRVGGTLNDYVTAMTVYRDQLYIGGAFTTPSHIARLEGNAWVPVGAGCNDNVRTMEVYHDSLFVGGSFALAGGIPALRIAKWHTPAAPQAAFSVEFPLLCPEGCTGFLDASTNEPLTYTWAFPGGVPTSSDVPTPFVCYPSPGTYPVSLTVSNEAGTSSTVIQDAVVVEVCSGTMGYDRSIGISVHLDPTNGTIRIERTDAIGAATYCLMDALGRPVLFGSFTGTNDMLDVHRCPTGTYVIIVESEHEMHRQRLLIQ